MSSAPLPEDVRSFRPSPDMAILSQRMDGSLPQVDIVANPRRSLRVGPDGPTPAPEVTLAAGAWETRTEMIPFEVLGEVV